MSKLLLAIVAILAATFYYFSWSYCGNREFRHYGDIMVNSPSVYTRERLVNDRFEEVEWLHKKLEEIGKERNLQPAVSISKTTEQNTRVEVSVSSQETARLQKQDDNAEASTGPRANNPKPAASSQLDDFKDIYDYREHIRNELMRVQLDDRHDIAGNTLYRLHFDATLIPAKSHNKPAIIVAEINESDVEMMENDIRQIYDAWKTELQEQINEIIALNASWVATSSSNNNNGQAIALQGFLRSYICDQVVSLSMIIDGSDSEALMMENQALSTAAGQEQGEGSERLRGDNAAMEIKKLCWNRKVIRVDGAHVDKTDKNLAIFYTIEEEIGKIISVKAIESTIYRKEEMAHNIRHNLESVLNGDIKTGAGGSMKNWVLSSGHKIFDIVSSENKDEFMSLLADIEQKCLPSDNNGQSPVYAPLKIFKYNGSSDSYDVPISCPKGVAGMDEKIFYIINVLEGVLNNKKLKEVKDIFAAIRQRSCCGRVECTIKTMQAIFDKIDTFSPALGLGYLTAFANNQTIKDASQNKNRGKTFGIERTLVTRLLSQFYLDKLSFTLQPFTNGSLNDSGGVVRLDSLFSPEIQGCDFGECKLALLPKQPQTDINQSKLLPAELNCKNLSDYLRNGSSNAQEGRELLLQILRCRTQVYAYSVTPLEQSQRVAWLVSQQTKLQETLNALAHLPNAQINGLVDNLHSVTSTLEQVQRNPLVIAFGASPGSAFADTPETGQSTGFCRDKPMDNPPQSLEGQPMQPNTCFGWVIRPEISATVKDERFSLKKETTQHAARHYSLSAVLSAPSWWRSMKLKIRVCWQSGNNGLLCDPRDQNQTVRLPGTAHDLFQTLNFDVIKVPYLSQQQVARIPSVEIGKPAEIVLQGGRLWRSTVVTLGSQRADSISVLPDMKAIAAKFDCIAPPADTGNSYEEVDAYALPGKNETSHNPPSAKSEKQSKVLPRKGENNQVSETSSLPVYLPVTVWTSEGKTQDNAMHALMLPFKKRSPDDLPCYRQPNNFEQAIQLLKQAEYRAPQSDTNKGK